MNKKILHTRAIAINFSDIVSSVRQNANVIVIFSLFSCGLIIGAVSLIISQDLNDVIAFYSGSRNDFLSIFAITLFIDLLLLTANFCMGFCCVGIPFISLAPIIYGFYIGSTFSSYLLLYSIKGIGAFILLKMPSYIISTVCLIVSSIISYKMSDRLIKTAFFNMKDTFSIRKYLIVYFMLLIGIIIAAVFDVLCNKLFYGIISL